MNGRSLELFFVDGDPEGLLTAEVFNWTGHVLHTPRTQIIKALSRKEASYTGVYLLTGERDGEPLAYIGEAEDIAKRIRQHDVGKEWWSTATLITSAANNLHKAHAAYLEAKLIDRAHSVGRMMLDNGNSPNPPSLPEAAKANMEGFLEYLHMVLPALRIDMFVSRKRAETMKTSNSSYSDQRSPEFELTLKRSALRASAVLIDGDFVVLKGSDARTDWIGSDRTGYSVLHEELVRTAVLATNGEYRIFSEDYAFKSTSAAAAVVTGRNAAGPDSWLLKGTEMTYKEWEKQQLSSAERDAA